MWQGDYEEDYVQTQGILLKQRMKEATDEREGF